MGFPAKQSKAGSCCHCNSLLANVCENNSQYVVAEGTHCITAQLYKTVAVYNSEGSNTHMTMHNIHAVHEERLQMMEHVIVI